MMGLRAKRVISDLTIYIILSVLVVIWLFPLLWMVLRAFDVNTGFTSLTIFPQEFTLDNFINLFSGSDYEAYPYGRWLLNT